MTRDAIEGALRRNITAILGDGAAEAPAEARLDDLGANSLERLDIILGTLDELDLSVRPSELAGCASIGALVDRLHGCCAPH